MSEATGHVHLWSEFDPQRYDPWEYFDNYRCDCGAESEDGATALPEPPRAPIYRLPNDLNVLQLNNVIDKVTAAMDAIKESAEDAGIDLTPESDGLEQALADFFTDRDARGVASAVLTGGA